MNRKYFKFHFLFWTILLFSSFGFSQTAVTDVNWITLESSKKDLSFDVPKNFLINNENGRNEIYAFQNNVSMSVFVINNKNVYRTPKNIPQESEVKVSRFKLDDFIGEVHKIEKGKKVSINIYMTSSEAYYSILISTKDSSNPTLGKFIGSLILRGKPLFQQKDPPNELSLSKVSIETLKTSPIILEVLKTKNTKKNNDSKKDEVKYEADNGKEIEDENSYSRPLIILQRPHPHYTDSARQNNISGTVKLKVKFLADGSVGNIVVLSKLDKSLERNAVEVARKIKFLPAEIDSKPADVTKIVTYHFTIY